MKSTILILLAFTFLACGQQPTEEIIVLQNRIDSLENKQVDYYIPGIGDLMSSIQIHHAKLWFAGQNENWELASFEIHELEEAIEDIEAFHTGRKEIEQIGMIIPALEEVESTIDQRDPIAFNTGFNILTNTCNACHQIAGYEFIVIKTPDIQPFANQDFALPNKKE